MARHQLLGKWGEADRNTNCIMASGIIRMDLRDTSAQATASVYTSASQAALIGSWHHLAVTYDGRGGATAADGLTFYIDGVAVPVTRINNPAYVAMENLTGAGADRPGESEWQQYDGGLDELRLWNLAADAPADSDDDDHRAGRRRTWPGRLLALQRRHRHHVADDSPRRSMRRRLFKAPLGCRRAAGAGGS